MSTATHNTPPPDPQHLTYITLALRKQAYDNAIAERSRLMVIAAIQAADRAGHSRIDLIRASTLNGTAHSGTTIDKYRAMAPVVVPPAPNLDAHLAATPAPTVQQVRT